MAFPAIPISQIHPGDGFHMTAFAIGLEDPGPAFGQPDIFGNQSGIEIKEIPHAQNTLLGQMADYLTVRQMAINTLSSSVRPLVPPGCIFGIHDMANVTEFCGFGFGIEFRRAEGGK
jgi:hypothetical protein